MERRISTTERDQKPFELFAIAAPGLEPLVEREVRALGVTRPTVEHGGIAFAGGRELLYRTNLHLRTASRIVVRVGEFQARGFAELVRHAKRTPWERFIDARRPLRVRVTSRKSKLYHTGAVAERVREAIAARLGSEPAAGSTDEEDESANGALVIVRLAHDHCLLRMDSSGDLLHRRGYREATAKAPLRETLAAALLLASQWPSDTPIIDPLCGSGTIAIEAARIARRIPSGWDREFGFMQWPDQDAALWARLREEARTRMLPHAPAPIIASDRDAGAIAAATANAERAGVVADIQFATQSISALHTPLGDSSGWVCTNPPYGARVSAGADVRNLYAQLGKTLRAKCAGWTVAMFAADDAHARATGLDLTAVLRTTNGGIPVRIVRGVVRESRAPA